MFHVNMYRFVLPLYTLLITGFTEALISNYTQQTTIQSYISQPARNDSDPADLTDNRLPQQVNISFTLENKPMTLNLTRNDDVIKHAKLLIGGEHNISQWEQDINIDFGLYEDRLNNANVVIWAEKQNRLQPNKYTATFQQGNRSYTMEPYMGGLGGGDFKSQDLTLEKGMEEDTAYVIRMEDNPASTNKISFLPDGVAFNSSVTQELAELGTRASRGRRYSYTLECLWFIDCMVYKRYLTSSRIKNAKERERDAIERIYVHYAHIAHGVNMRYRGIKTLDISVRITGISIQKHCYNSPWTEVGEHVQYDRGVKYAEANGALVSLEAWLEKNRKGLPPFDQVSVFTGNQMYYGRSIRDGRRITILGIGRIAGICTKYSTVINRALGIFGTTQTAAHEIAHNLGVGHDGVSNECRPSDQYIMASTPGQLTKSTYQNAYQFSPCSLVEMRDYIMHLTVQDMNCLLKSSSRHKPNVNVKDLVSGVLPGERWDIDEQCRQINGKESFYCAGEENDRKLCQHLVCYDPSKRTCAVGGSDNRAVSGTPCGNKKFCMMSNCISDKRARPFKAITASCVYGDYKIKLPEGQKCRETIEATPWKCYSEYFRQKCCESCHKIKTLDNKGCEYGDKAPHCSGIQPSSCYSSHQTCCGTCKKHITEVPDCTYGDKASWCESHSRRRCYDGRTRSLCCLRCHTVKNQDNPKCPYGDRIADCRPQDCQTQRGLHDCCHTCKSRITGGTGCEDRATWCYTIKVDKCSRVYYNTDWCCSTCHRLTATGGHPGPDPCPDGDRVSWCYKISPKRCTRAYYNRDWCCQTCQRFSSNKKVPAMQVDCKDKYKDCHRRKSSECYNDSVRRDCCGTCRNRHSGISGCEFGDHNSWCKTEYCKTEKDACCQTCR